MKYSVAAAALALASGVVAKPQITNSAAINPEEGKAFTLQLSGCSAGCTVYLMQGPKDGQVPVKVLDSSATTSAKITLNNIGSGSYSIRVKDNSVTGTAGDSNSNNDYTSIFNYTGTGPTSFPPLSGSASATSASSASASSSGSSSSASSASSSATTTGSSSSASSSATSSASSTSATSASKSSTSSASKTSSSAAATATSTPPPSSGNMLALSPLGLIGAAVAALFL
ncbi:hypothetical protein ISF_06486 [Cordyceps fumosorosea ARSEF 2679]|uniref:Extracellular matrix protein n=1 Tax=Cordyceps fumosorosea (strain ARSEF 2679) TaxID=1081104 RepID=A0A167RL64_CORFA|nr:hypothetical protein ISF_06486 [Cordyceps fumosorosea ARSEF 2679]OAA58703.1 hypothetical protein ISF_06486 [Cordyceps fumosorosea ARSEF 2679]